MVAISAIYHLFPILQKSHDLIFIYSPAYTCFLLVSAPRSCARDEGRPLGASLQGQAPNHLKLLWSNARVVSVKEKAL